MCWLCSIISIVKRTTTKNKREVKQMKVKVTLFFNTIEGKRLAKAKLHHAFTKHDYKIIAESNTTSYITLDISFKGSVLALSTGNMALKNKHYKDVDFRQSEGYKFCTVEI